MAACETASRGRRILPHRSIATGRRPLAGRNDGIIRQDSETGIDFFARLPQSLSIGWSPPRDGLQVRLTSAKPRERSCRFTLLTCWLEHRRRVCRLDEFEAVAERIGDVEAAIAGEWFVFAWSISAVSEARPKFVETLDQKGGVGLQGRTEVVLDPEMDLLFARCKPNTAAGGRDSPASQARTSRAGRHRKRTPRPHAPSASPTGRGRHQGSSRYTASRKRSAVSRSTETSCETPRSAMVTPNRRFIRAMVIGLWVIDDEARVGRPGHLVEQVAEALDIGVVERRVDLVEHADRRRVGEEHGEDQRQRGQRLLAAGQQRHDLRLLARRAGDDLEAGLERIVGFGELQLGRRRRRTGG